MLWLAYFGHCPEAKLIHGVESTDLKSIPPVNHLFRQSFITQRKVWNCVLPTTMNPSGQRQHATDGFRWEAALPADQMFLDFKEFLGEKVGKNGHDAPPIKDWRRPMPGYGDSWIYHCLLFCKLSHKKCLPFKFHNSWPSRKWKRNICLGLDKREKSKSKLFPLTTMYRCT